MDTKDTQSRRKLVVVGAGPVGCLCALAFAKQGWEVDIFEGRPGKRVFFQTCPGLIPSSADMRDPEAKVKLSLRSINLAISSRGITALSVVDPAIADRFMENVIPMRGRMIHDSHGQCQSQAYDQYGQVGPETRVDCVVTDWSRSLLTPSTGGC